MPTLTPFLFRPSAPRFGHTVTIQAPTDEQLGYISQHVARLKNTSGDQTGRYGIEIRHKLGFPGLTSVAIQENIVEAPGLPAIRTRNTRETRELAQVFRQSLLRLNPKSIINISTR